MTHKIMLTVSYNRSVTSRNTATHSTTIIDGRCMERKMQEQYM